MVPKVFEPLKFYCILSPYQHDSSPFGLALRVCSNMVGTADQNLCCHIKAFSKCFDITAQMLVYCFKSQSVWTLKEFIGIKNEAPGYAARIQTSPSLRCTHKKYFINYEAVYFSLPKQSYGPPDTTHKKSPKYNTKNLDPSYKAAKTISISYCKDLYLCFLFFWMEEYETVFEG